MRHRFAIDMNKSQKSLLNAITALLNMAVTSIIGLVLGKTILSHYGSEYNGINATVSQIVNTIMVLEGGFTLASNIALFKPFSAKDYNTANGILAATKKRFFTVGVIAFAIGVVIALVYPLTVSTSMPYIEFFLLMLTVLIPSCFNLGVNMKHRVILLTEQKEYIISLFSSITYTIGNIAAIFAMNMGATLLVARLIIMCSLLLNYGMIALYCKHKYSFIDFKVKPLFNEIKGTKSVIALKLTSIAYTTLPIIAISMIPEKGAFLASIYAVYKSVMSMVKNCLTSISNAPRLGFGALLAEGRDDDAQKLFGQYEMISCIGLSVVLGTTGLLIMPFVDIYTREITDINYHNIPLALMMLTTVFLEILHIPSGQLIQMSGKFDVSKNIQLAACVILLLTLVIGGFFFGLYGIVASTLFAAAFLAIAEIGYIRLKVFKDFKTFIKNAIPSAVICSVATFVGLSGKLSADGYFEFCVFGVISVAVLSVLTALLYFIVNRKQLFSTVKLAKGIFARRK